MSEERKEVREDDARYFSRRALQEQVAAQTAKCHPARIRHDVHHASPWPTLARIAR
jgi:hypothetical protein